MRVQHQACCTRLGTEKVVVGVNRNESDDIGTFVIINSAVIASHIDASTPRIRFVQRMVIQKRLEWIFLKEQQSVVTASL